MRWPVALVAAALIGPPWAGGPTPAGAATPGAAPSREALAQGVKQSAGAEGLAVASAMASGMSLATLQSALALEAGPEATINQSEDVAADAEGPAGQRRVTMKLRVQGSGSRLTLHADFTAQEQRGASRVNARARLTVGLDYCPDKDGKVAAEIDYQASGDTGLRSAAGSAGYSNNLGVKGQVTGTVSDQAVLTSITKQLSGTTSTRGGQNPGPSARQGAGPRTSTSGSYVYTSSTPLDSKPVADSVDVPLTRGAGDAGRLDASRSDDPQGTAALGELTQLWLDIAIQSIFEKAQAKWRSGACVEVVVRPPVSGSGKANPTRPGERKPFEAAVRHKTEQVELPLPLDASLDGREALEPRRVERAPGRFTFTAGPGARDYGHVALRTVSRRGIGKERVSFLNEQRLAGTFKVHNRDAQMDLRIEGDVSWQPKPGAPDIFVPSGTVRVSGTRQMCTVRGEAELSEQNGELQVKRDANGRPVEYRGRGLKMMPMRFTCPKAAISQPMPAAWFNTTQAFRPVGSDGVIEGGVVEGDTRWTWRFTP